MVNHSRNLSCNSNLQTLHRLITHTETPLMLQSAFSQHTHAILAGVLYPETSLSVLLHGFTSLPATPI